MGPQGLQQHFPMKGWGEVSCSMVRVFRKQAMPFLTLGKSEFT